MQQRELVRGCDELCIQLEKEVESSRGFGFVDVASENQVGGVVVAFALDEGSVERGEAGVAVSDFAREDLELFTASSFDEGAGDEMIDDLMAPTFSDLAHHGADPRTFDGGGEGDAAFVEEIEDLVEVLKFFDGDGVEFAGGVTEFDVLLKVDCGGCGFAFEVCVIDEDAVQLVPHVLDPSFGKFGAPEEHGLEGFGGFRFLGKGTAVGSGKVPELAGVTFWADSVREVAAGVCVDVALDLLPVVGIVADPFTVHADGNQLFEATELGGEVENALGDTEPHENHFAVQWFREEVVHFGVHRGAQVVASGMDGGEEDEVGVIGFTGLADAFAELDAVAVGHHPVADDDANGVVLECGPRGFAVGGGQDGVASVFEAELEHLEGDGIVFSDEDFHGGTIGWRRAWNGDRL